MRAVKVRWSLRGLVVELPGQGTAVGRAGRYRIGWRMCQGFVVQPLQQRIGGGRGGGVGVGSARSIIGQGQ